MNKAPLLIPAVLGLAFLPACPPKNPGGPGGGGGGAGLDPSACGTINVGPASRRMHSFLVASAELDRAGTELENSVVGACRKMAAELGINPMGDTRTVCNAVAAELDANLKVSVSQEKRLVTREVPGECHTEWSFGATAAAQCSAQADVESTLRCNGTCQGTCKGACDGTCVGGNAGGVCNSQCNGACNGRCEGGCQGYITGDVEAECRAAVEIQSSSRTVCTPPKLVVEEQTVTIVDATKFARAQAAIQTGLPTIRAAAMKAELLARAAVDWAKTAGGLVVASGDLVQELGEKSVCVAGQVGAAVAAAAQVQAHFSVSIEVSASISGSAGVQ